MRAAATFAAAIVIASTFPASTTATGNATTQLTADEARLAAAASVLVAAPPAAPPRHLGPDRAARSVRTAAAVTSAARTAIQTAQTTAAKKPQTTPVKKAVVKKPTVKKAPPKPVTVKKRPATPVPAAAPASGSRVNIVVGFALAQVGKPYVWGAAGPGSYDCSGLTMTSFARVGIRLPHQSGGQASAGRAVSRAQLQRGDLILYSGHVAIALGGNKMVHAANPRTGIVVATIYGSPIGYRRLL